MLPPGRARLATRPFPTGSPTPTSTMGIVVVACWAARAAGTFGTTPSGGCYTANLSATGRQWVNRTGTTQFRLRFARDDNDDLGDDFIKFYSGNSPNIAARPTLIIKYYVP